MLSYSTSKINHGQFLALTSLEVIEFEFLLTHFAPRSERYFRYRTWAGNLRAQPRYQPASDEKLADPAQQLFFLLVFLKNNPLQSFQAALFDLSQGSVSQMVRRLLSLLNETLTGMQLSPCQDTDSLRRQLDRLKPGVLNLDATERSVSRSTDPDVQREEYSGKGKDHTSKNQLLCDDSAYVHFLSLTYPGKIHDKALADSEALDLPPGLLLRQDTGYQGYQPVGVIIQQPLKKPRGGQLTESQKAANQAISAKRVIVEHAINGIKRLHCLTQRLRLKGGHIRDVLMCIGTALHNLRVTSPCRAYQPLTPAWALCSQI